MSVTRSLEVAAAGGTPDMDSTTAGGPYQNALSTVGMSAAGVVTADAVQVSGIPLSVGPSMNGTGTVGSVAGLTGTGTLSALAESVFDVTFTVDAPGLYTLFAEVFWEGASPPYEGASIVQLQDEAMNELAFRMQSFDMQGIDALDTTVTLNPGTTYTLLARTTITGSGNPGAGVHAANANWEFELAAVPEPGPVLIMTPLAIVATWSAWRSRRKSRA